VRSRARDCCALARKTHATLADDNLGDEHSSTNSEEDWSSGLESRFVGGDGSTDAAVGLGELALALGSELNAVVSSEGGLVGFLAGHGQLLNHFSSDDLHGFGAAGVLASEVNVELGDGAAQRVGSEFLVHVHGIGVREVSEEDAVVSDAGGVLLEDLRSRNDLALALADLVLALHEVPELGASEHLVASKHTHSEELGLGALLRGQSSADNVKLSHLQPRFAKSRHLLSSA